MVVLQDTPSDGDLSEHTLIPFTRLCQIRLRQTLAWFRVCRQNGSARPGPGDLANQPDQKRGAPGHLCMRHIVL